MQPPICELCFDRFEPSEASGLVRFADYVPLTDGVTGHPDGLLWFCEHHFPRALALKDKSSSDALRILRSSQK